MVRLQKLCRNPLAEVLVKLEFMNPSGSIKDRIARHILATYERRGVLRAGGVVVENSSGNTAASVSMLCALRGYHAIIVVPNKCSQEKKAAIQAYGAHLVVSPDGVGIDSPDHYENIAKRLEKEIPGAVRLDQYNNELNVEAHYSTTGPEIWRQTQGRLDYFVAGASTGGTISGVGRYLKERSNNRVRIVAADPHGSAILDMVTSGQFVNDAQKTEIEGLGKNYPCECLRFESMDEALRVEDSDAFHTARRMAREEGILCGISSGANVWAALKIAEAAKSPTTVVAVLPDGGAKYLSKLFNDEWLAAKKILPAELLRTQATGNGVGGSLSVEDVVKMCRQNNDLNVTHS